MNATDNFVYGKYSDEAKKRWGSTDAYKEFENKTADCSDGEMNDAAAGLNAVFAEFAFARRNGEAPESETVQKLTEKLRQYITDNFYTCTPEILKGLGQMYVADEHFRANIDKNGVGTAEFVSQAITAYR